MHDPAESEENFPTVPETSHLIPEDEVPVDIRSEKNQRLLVSSLYASWAGAPSLEIDGEVVVEGPRPFLATANVGLFDRPVNDPLVPDVLVSNDVQLGPHDWGPEGTRSYFIWEHGKPPELVIELVSNRKGGELARKRQRYARMRVAHYVVFDAGRQLGGLKLRAYKLVNAQLEPVLVPSDGRVDIDPLGLWEGNFEHQDGLWLRFFDREGRLLLTGDERALAEGQRAEAESQRAEAERLRADAERQRAEAQMEKAEALAAKLRELGVDPESL